MKIKKAALLLLLPLLVTLLVFLAPGPVKQTGASAPAAATNAELAQAGLSPASVPPVASAGAPDHAPSPTRLRAILSDPGLGLEERLAAARERGRWMRDLMVTHPAQALAGSLSFADYAELPEAVRLLVERPFSRAAEWRALPVCGDGHSLPPGAPDMVFEMRAENTDLKAHPVGRRTGVGSKQLAALQGFELDGHAVVREEVLQVLEERDARAARGFFGMPVANSDETRDFLTGEPITGAPVTAAAGGRLFLFANEANASRLNDELARMEEKPGPRAGSKVILQAAAVDGGFSLEQAWAEADFEASSWTETAKSIYVIRVDFPDYTGEPVSQAAIAATINTTVSNQVRNMSYGKTWVNATVSPMVVRLPSGTNTYLPEANGTLHDNAKAAFNALGTGVNLANYDIVVVAFKGIGLRSGGVLYAGLAGGGSMWLQGSFGERVITHELGHNYGISHAKFWTTSDGSVVGAGSTEEYGDPFDIMGSGPVPEGHYHPQGKSVLNWLPTTQWTSISNVSGTWRVWRIDHAGTAATNRCGLRISKSASNEWYWVGYRRAFTNQPHLSGGAYLLWQQPSAASCHLLDTTPGSADGKNDAGIDLGRTYSDWAANLHITPVAQGGSGADEWLDVRVNKGPFAGNRAPVVSISGPSTVAARTTATFSVTGSDPDGDTLAYQWNPGSGTIAGNTSSISCAWQSGGSYSVSVIVSDMKGLTATQTLAVTVTDPLITWSNGTLSPSKNMYAMSYLRGRFIALGKSYSFLSFDGINWEGTSLPDVNHYPAAVAEGGGHYVAVGYTYDFNVSSWVGAAYRSDDGRRWTAAMLPRTGNLNGVACGDGVWIAVGETGSVLRSVDDGTNWTVVNVPGTPPYLFNNIAAVTYANGLFMAVGDTNVFTSTNGLVWTDCSRNTGLENWRQLKDVTYWNGRFYAGGWYAGIRYSADNGQTWQAAAVPGFDYDIRSVIAGDGWIMAAADRLETTNTPVLLLSGDGVNWQEMNASPNLIDMAFGAGRVVGLAGAGLTKMTGLLYASNHAPTTALSGPTNGTARTTLTFTASDSDADGDTVRHIWDLGTGSPLQEGAVISQNWTAGGTYSMKLYATDERGGLTVVTQSVVISDPLANWTARTSGTTTTLYDICTGTNGSGAPIALAVGAGGGTACFSTNGSNWTVSTTGSINAYLYGVIHDGKNFIASGEDYFFGATNAWLGSLWTSPNGTAWTRRMVWGTNIAFNDVAVGGGVLVAVGDNGKMLRSTNRGTNWSVVSSGVTNNLLGIAWGNGVFVAVGGNGNGSGVQVLTSADGLTWANTTTNSGVDGSWQNFKKVQFCNDRFLASGWYSKIRHSTDGGASFSTTRTTTEETPALAYGNGVYFAAGLDRNNGGADINLVSSDGASWTALTTASQNDRNAAVFFNNTFITVGVNGTIMQSDLLPSAAGWPLYQQQQWPGLPAGSGFTDDYDHDGAANGVEYALGTDPRSSASRVSITCAITGGYLTLTAQRTAIQPDVACIVERSTNLVQWTTNTLTLTNSATRLVVRSTISGAPVEFLRLKVVLP